MNPELEQKWAEAERTGKPVEVGRAVVCDFCDDDCTDKPDSGGLIFGSKAVCPKCTPKLRADIARYGEEQYVRAECPEGQSFADFIRAHRAKTGSTTIRVSRS